MAVFEGPETGNFRVLPEFSQPVEPSGNSNRVLAASGEKISA